MSEIETILLGMRDEGTAPSEQQWHALSEFVSKQSHDLDQLSVQSQHLSEQVQQFSEQDQKRSAEVQTLSAQVQMLTESSSKLNERVEILTQLLQR